MKKYGLLCILFVSVLMPLMAEKMYKLDEGILTIAKNLSTKLPKGTKVVILDIKAETPEASTYIIEELTYELLEIGTLRVVDRESLEAIRAELSFQTSGDVSDDSVQRLGAMLGAETLISGSFELLRDKYRLAIKAVKVETSEIQHLSSLPIVVSTETEALLGKQTKHEVAAATVGKAARGVADFTGRMICSTINPFIGIGSFIQGDFAGGRKVVFWEIVGALGLWYGNYREEENKSNGEVYMALGGISLGGAIIYSWIRPWMYNREPKVTGVLDNVQISTVSGKDLSAGYIIRY